MNKKLFWIGGATLAVAAAVLFFASGMTTWAQNDEAKVQRTLSVFGQGVVKAVPDVLQATVGVETESLNLSDALAENNTRMANVLVLLKSLGVEDRDVQTVQFYISERRDNDGRITGFFVINSVQVTLRDLNAAGGILDQLVQAGANSISGIQLTISDASELVSQARALAVENAKAKARELANAAGMFLGNPITISESGGYESFAVARAAAAEFDKAVPIAAGESSVSIGVSIVYEMF